MFGLFRKKRGLFRTAHSTQEKQIRPAHAVSFRSVRTAPQLQTPSGFCESGNSQFYSYDPYLIDVLERDHLQLLTTLQSMRKSFVDGYLAEATLFMERLRLQMTDHLLKEDARFYMYLETMLTDDLKIKNNISKIREEMKAIDRAVMEFLDKYRNLASELSLSESFGAEVQRIGQIVVARIQKEEKLLYPLYQPVQA